MQHSISTKNVYESFFSLLLKPCSFPTQGSGWLTKRRVPILGNWQLPHFFSLVSPWFSCEKRAKVPGFFERMYTGCLCASVRAVLVHVCVCVWPSMTTDIKTMTERDQSWLFLGRPFNQTISNISNVAAHTWWAMQGQCFFQYCSWLAWTFYVRAFHCLALSTPWI